VATAEEATCQSTRAYEELRRIVPSGPSRTARMQLWFEDVRREARSSSLNRDQVRELFHQGDEGLRIYALALMQGNERLADFAAALEAIGDSKSAFEQYQGIELARRMVSTLEEPQREQLVALLQRQRLDGWIKPGTERWRLSQQVLDGVTP
jgi:hypothetical protein